jgi:hypothetical protein
MAGCEIVSSGLMMFYRMKRIRLRNMFSHEHIAIRNVECIKLH